MNKHRLVWLTSIFMIFSQMTFADHLMRPTGPVVLTVSGNIEHTNNGDTAEFDREMLMALGQGTIVTENPWTDGMNTYQGPIGQALIDAVGANGETLTLTALNDYSSDVPRSDIVEFGVIFAMSMNGERLRIRDRGPLFVIYPFSEKPELSGERYHNRSVWQVNRITVR